MDVLYNLRGKEIGEVRPSLIETLKLRESGLCILHEKQIDLLREWRKNQNEFLLEELLVTVNAIASGLRTTG
ncbi:Phosphoenolpyruvate carboxylase (PEPCase; PEPC) [Leptospira biflexa serovar Patoc strain 'Patoc 1 (Paris)']|uniref:Phosphoenolpyruvate carboxylase n=2 Tax=Leptospira biflexa TaxID=172 RepID=B0SLJ9_LEPBP|nr:Phosphoenolpyruvate carboxylase (PEPCase; PEPC) [Leptospira biflexa serovar Patoc strain 'Patoc 1 (Paris)']